MPNKILVTGGAGYIGSHIVHDLCDRGYEVVILDDLSLGRDKNIDERAKFIKGSVLSYDDLDKTFAEGISTVYHFAAWKAAGESMDDPYKYSRNNINGTLTLLGKMVEYGVRNIIFSSSAAVYGAPVYLPIDENHPRNPENYYGYTKLVIEENLNWYSKLKGIKFAALRYFNATGYDIKGRIKGQEYKPQNLIPIVMETACGQRSEMKVFGNDYDTPDGTGIRDYIHVTDLSSAHFLAMKYIQEEDKNLTVNLGAGLGYSVLEIINKTTEHTGKDVNYNLTGRRAGDPANVIACSKMAKEVLGWEAKHSDIDTIIKSMVPLYFK